MSTRPRDPNVRARTMPRSVASRSSATYTLPARRNSGSHAGCQPPVPCRPHAPVSLSPTVRTDSVSGIPSQRSGGWDTPGPGDRPRGRRPCSETRGIGGFHWQSSRARRRPCPEPRVPPRSPREGLGFHLTLQLSGSQKPASRVKKRRAHSPDHVVLLLDCAQLCAVRAPTLCFGWRTSTGTCAMCVLPFVGGVLIVAIASGG
jgi:hypothetical protein